jgi:hypothetical protein
MDHSCHKCGYKIEEGKPFCPQCAAPQIRVAISEAAPESTLDAGEIVPSALGRELGLGSSSFDASALPAGSYPAVKPCALGAAVALLLLLLRVNPFAAALGAGFLAVLFSRRRLGIGIRAAAGARLGALSGLFFFTILTLLEASTVAVLHKGAEVRSEMIDKIQQAAARYPGPEVQPVLDFAKSPGGLAFMMAASLVFGFAAFVLLGGIGGALGAAILGRRDRP